MEICSIFIKQDVEGRLKSSDDSSIVSMPFLNASLQVFLIKATSKAF